MRAPKLLTTLWYDESGAAGRDCAILVAVFAMACVVWLEQFGGGGPVHDILSDLKFRAVNICRSAP